jgi:hypothetical protein
MEEDRSARQAFIQDLRTARDYQQMSLEQVAQTTHISLAYLRALEEDRWDAIPAPFLRGYLTAYAECLGMFREKVLKRFDELDWRPAASGERPGTGWRPDPARPSEEPALPHEARTRADKVLVPGLWDVVPASLKGLVAGLALALFLVAALGVVWILPDGDGDASAVPQLEETGAGLLESARVQNLEFRLVRSGTLTLSVDGKPVFRGTVKADSILALDTPNEVQVVVDRVEDLRLALDGRPLDVPADSGSAVLRVFRGVAGLIRRTP